MNSPSENPNHSPLEGAMLTAYALGQLGAAERAAVEAQLAHSEQAQRFVEETAALAEHVAEARRRSAPLVQPSASLRAAVEKRLQEKAKEELTMATIPTSTAARGRRKRRVAALLALAGCLLLVAVPTYFSLSGRWLSGRLAQRTEEKAAARLAVGRLAPRSMDRSMDTSEHLAVAEPAPEATEASPPPARYDVSLHAPADPTAKPAGAPSALQDSVMWSTRPIREATAPRSSDFSYQREPALEPPGETASGTEQYEPIAENRFLTVAQQPLSTFSIDVDTASYANVRRFLTQGQLPPPDAVRIEEMVNYFPYHYSPPSGGTPFAVNMEVAQCPWNGAHRLLRIGLKGREVHQQERGPSNLVFLLDVSGSMADANKLPLVKQAMAMLVGQLGEDDRVSIVTYASGTEVRLPSTAGRERGQILAVIESLSSGGSTHGSAGIQLAYEQASEHFIRGGVNRVVLATDGDLNVGITDDDQLVQLIQEKAKSGVFLTVLGFGMGNLKDAKMEKLADKGNGTYAYIDNLREARKVLIEQISGNLVTIAKDVKIQVEFNPAEVQSYRLVGYENRALAARDFHDDRKDAGEIGAGHMVTALYELVPAGGKPPVGASEHSGLRYQRGAERDLTDQARSGELLTLRLRYKEPEEATSKLLECTVRDAGKRFGEGSADFRFAAAVAGFGMVLRNSPNRGDLTPAAVEEIAAAAIDDDPSGYRAEFVELVRRARQLLPPTSNSPGRPDAEPDQSFSRPRASTGSTGETLVAPARGTGETPVAHAAAVQQSLWPAHWFAGFPLAWQLLLVLLLLCLLPYC